MEPLPNVASGEKSVDQLSAFSSNKSVIVSENAFNNGPSYAPKTVFESNFFDGANKFNGGVLNGEYSFVS